MFFCSFIAVVTLTSCNYAHFLFNFIGTPFAFGKLSADFVLIKKQKRNTENA